VDPTHGRTQLLTVADDWLLSLVHLKPKTLVRLRERCDAMCCRAWAGWLAVGRVDQRRVRRFIADLLGGGVSPARVRKAVGILRQILGLAVEDGLIRAKPCEDMKLPRMNPRGDVFPHR
jgi:site-specific recombinase XerC